MMNGTMLGVTWGMVLARNGSILMSIAGRSERPSDCILVISSCLASSATSQHATTLRHQ